MKSPTPADLEARVQELLQHADTMRRHIERREFEGAALEAKALALYLQGASRMAERLAEAAGAYGAPVGEAGEGAAEVGMCDERIDVLEVLTASAKRLRAGVEGPRNAELLDRSRELLGELFERADYLCRTGEGMLAFKAALACVRSSKRLS